MNTQPTEQEFNELSRWATRLGLALWVDRYTANWSCGIDRKNSEETETLFTVWSKHSLMAFLMGYDKAINNPYVK